MIVPILCTFGVGEREREMQVLFLLTVQLQEARENSVVWEAAVLVFVLFSQRSERHLSSN
jgi:hypothetical protein